MHGPPGHNPKAAGRGLERDEVPKGSIFDKSEKKEHLQSIMVTDYIALLSTLSGVVRRCNAAPRDTHCEFDEGHMTRTHCAQKGAVHHFWGVRLDATFNVYDGPVQTASDDDEIRQRLSFDNTRRFPYHHRPRITA